MYGITIGWEWAVPGSCVVNIPEGQEEHAYPLTRALRIAGILVDEKIIRPPLGIGWRDTIWDR